jgi:hypothetical protein
MMGDGVDPYDSAEVTAVDDAGVVGGSSTSSFGSITTTTATTVAAAAVAIGSTVFLYV